MSTLPPLAAPTAALRVGVRTYDWTDWSRRTPANGHYRSRRGREIVTTIWYPARGPAGKYVHVGASPDVVHGPFPVVLLAHGHDGEPADYTADASNWASHGYVVVAPAFPLSRRRALGGPTYDDLVNQPGDLAFALTRVLADNTNSGSWLHHLVDARRVGAVGHSEGAWTVLALAANPCCRDRRVSAAVLYAGAMAAPFTAKFFSSGAPPTLFVHARDDATVPYLMGQQAYRAARKPTYFLTVPRGGHISPYQGARTPAGAAVLQVTDDFMDHYLRGAKTAKLAAPDPRFATLARRL
jgi:predicted dienelactone hydrolase